MMVLWQDVPCRTSASNPPSKNPNVAWPFPSAAPTPANSASHEWDAELSKSKCDPFERRLGARGGGSSSFGNAQVIAILKHGQFPQVYCFMYGDLIWIMMMMSST
jgi:hypothetical protein